MIDPQNVVPVSMGDIAVLQYPSTYSGKNTIEPKSLQYKKSNILKFRTSLGRKGDYEQPEYNLYEISAAEDGDSFVRRSIIVKSGLMTKEGWSYQGRNAKTVDYIYERIVQLSFAANMPFNILLKDTMTDLIRYHNAFWVKVRNDSSSGGKRRLARGYAGKKNFKPIAAYFRMPPETISVKTDESGNPVKYIQYMPDGRYKEHSADNIVHFHFNRRAGFTFACPGIWPAIEDIRLLRQLEEYLELLVEKQLFPLLILTIGNDNWPASGPETYLNGQSEIDIWTEKINTMDISDGIAVSHRQSFSLLETKNVLPIEEYLKYFKQRAFSGLGVSPIEMGETNSTNKSTADRVSDQLVNDIKNYQQSFKWQFEFEILNELLLEKYDYSVLSPNNIVEFVFNEIDYDSLLKLQNHYALMYTMGQITEDEMRENIGMRALSEESRKGLYLWKYEIPKAKEVGKLTDKDNSASIKSSSNKSKPANQHKTKTSPKKDEIQLSMLLDHILYDFDQKDMDLTSMQITNALFSIDSTLSTSNICTDIFEKIDTYVNMAYADLENSELTYSEIADTLKNRITGLVYDII